MSSTFIRIGVFACIAFTFGSAHAATKRVVAGYHCMMLNQTLDQMRNPDATVFFKATPEDSAPNGSPVGTVVAVSDTGEKNGYLPALTFTGRHQWVKATAIAPYKVASDPSMKCAPAIRNDGKTDFIFSH